MLFETVIVGVLVAASVAWLVLYLRRALQGQGCAGCTGSCLHSGDAGQDGESCPFVNAIHERDPDSNVEHRTSNVERRM